VFKTAGYGVDVETDPFFPMRRISYLMKIVQNCKYFKDLPDGPNLSDTWEPGISHKESEWRSPDKGKQEARYNGYRWILLSLSI
jgi:hypothetical protein